MSAKSEALIEVTNLIRQNGLTLEDIAAALKTDLKEEKSSGILGKIFSYIGVIFIFAGYGEFIRIQWNEIDTIGRIMLTLGVGYTVFMIAIVLAKDGRFERAATALFIISTLMQPAGIIVALKEYSQGSDPAYGLMFMNFVMLTQQGLVFIALRQTFFALSSIFFGTSMFSIGFDLLHVDHHLEGATIGLSLTAIAWALGNSRHRAIAGITYFIGGAIFLGAAWHWLYHSPGEILFLGLTCGVIFLSTVARSRALLTLGTLSTIAYICDFTAEHFPHNDAWPFVLMLMGGVMIGIGALAVKLNRKYIARA